MSLFFAIDYHFKNIHTFWECNGKTGYQQRENSNKNTSHLHFCVFHFCCNGDLGRIKRFQPFSIGFCHRYHLKENTFTCCMIIHRFLSVLFIFYSVQDCVFNKNFSDTSLHVYWTGVLRIANCNGCCKRWYFTFNGAECSGPLPIDGIVYMGKGSDKNLHRVRHIERHCNNIHKGKVCVGFWVGNCAGISGSYDAYTGWNSVSRIFIEEVPKPQA